MSGYAWVTLATNNSYSLGALVLAHSLKKSNTCHKLAVLITPAVSEAMREQLGTVFDVVKIVDVLDSKDEAHLALMQRPDLGITFTKIHCWRLTEFEKCVFLDADTLVVRNCDELFEREEFSAAPDVSWPDCFNSGVFVYRPSVETFNKLLQFAVENRSFDGGDQGLLNQFFSDWATEDIKKHLPFVYNLTSVAAYSYIPAFKHYGSETRIVHFIGAGKPWLQQLDAATRTVTPSLGSEHLAPLLQQWWDLFCEKVHPNLDKNLESSNDGMSHPPVEACSNSLPIALTDEPPIEPRSIEPCTPYREKDDFRQHNLPYQPFEVRGSSGELLNVEFLLASAVPPNEPVEQQRQQEVEMEEKELPPERSETQERVINESVETPKYEEPKPVQDQQEEIREPQQQYLQEEPPPVKDPFAYHSFFPDETCVNTYLEQNMVSYQIFDNHQEVSNDTVRIPQQVPPPLPRFLTIPENDCRQSGNTEAEPLKSYTWKEPTPPREPSPPSEQPQQQQQQQLPPKQQQQQLLPPQLQQQQQQQQQQLLPPQLQQQQLLPPQQEQLPPQHPQQQPLPEKRELTKSKSMPYLYSDVTTVGIEPPPPEPPRSIWKSQPDVNVEFNRKFSMPRLKPILPKQNSFKTAPSSIPKITSYTEFLMSSEYKDPVDLPKDKEGFVETYIHKEAKLRRSKSDVGISSKFGPLPYANSPEIEKPVILKKSPFRHLDNEFYDLAHCKRQMGNKPKPENVRRKENICPLPPLKPLVPGKDKKSTLIKKRKSKELSPQDGGREKVPKIMKEGKRVNAPKNDLDEILQRLKGFSKDYQHFFKVQELNKTANVQGSIKTSTSSRPKETPPFQQFRNYVRDKSETNQKGLSGIHDICPNGSDDRLEGQQQNERLAERINLQKNIPRSVDNEKEKRKTHQKSKRLNSEQEQGGNDISQRQQHANILQTPAAERSQEEIKTVKTVQQQDLTKGEQKRSQKTPAEAQKIVRGAQVEIGLSDKQQQGSEKTSTENTPDDEKVERKRLTLESKNLQLIKADGLNVITENSSQQQNESPSRMTQEKSQTFLFEKAAVQQQDENVAKESLISESINSKTTETTKPGQHQSDSDLLENLILENAESESMKKEIQQSNGNTENISKSQIQQKYKTFQPEIKVLENQSRLEIKNYVENTIAEKETQQQSETLKSPNLSDQQESVNSVPENIILKLTTKNDKPTENATDKCTSSDRKNLKQGRFVISERGHITTENQTQEENKTSKSENILFEEKTKSEGSTENAVGENSSASLENLQQNRKIIPEREQSDTENSAQQEKEFVQSKSILLARKTERERPVGNIVGEDSVTYNESLLQERDKTCEKEFETVENKKQQEPLKRVEVIVEKESKSLGDIKESENPSENAADNNVTYKRAIPQQDRIIISEKEDEIAESETPQLESVIVKSKIGSEGLTENAAVKNFASNEGNQQQNGSIISESKNAENKPQQESELVKTAGIPEQTTENSLFGEAKNQQQSIKSLENIATVMKTQQQRNGLMAGEESHEEKFPERIVEPATEKQVNGIEEPVFVKFQQEYQNSATPITTTAHSQNQQKHSTNTFQNGNFKSYAVVPSQNGKAVPGKILCVPDFDTPRTSRVSPPTAKHRPKPKKGFKNYVDGSPDETANATSVPSSSSSFPHQPSRPSTPLIGGERPKDWKATSGIAGAIAQLNLEAGSGQTAESAAASTAHQEYLRRQNWETGNMDYMGKDSFDNIWSKICQTLEGKEAEDQEAPTSFITTPQKCPEYIDMLPHDPVTGPVEDDEIIFSKMENKKPPYLMNIAEEEETPANGGKVKLSDILLPGAGAKPVGMSSEGKPVATSEAKVQPTAQPSTTAEDDASQTLLGKPQPSAGAIGLEPKIPSVTPESKPQATTAVADTRDSKSQPSGGALEDKPQLSAATADSKPMSAPIDTKSQTSTTPENNKSQSSNEKAQLNGATSQSKPQPPPAIPELKPQTVTTAVVTEGTKSQPPAKEPQVSAATTELKSTPITPETKPQLSTNTADAESQLPVAALGEKTQPSAAKSEPKPQPFSETKSQMPTDTKSQPSDSSLDEKPQVSAPTADSKPDSSASDIKSQASSTPADKKAQLSVEKSQPAAATGSESQLTPVTSESKPQTVTAVEDTRESKSQPSGGALEDKPQPSAVTADSKPSPASETKSKASTTPADSKSQRFGEKTQPPAATSESKPQPEADQNPLSLSHLPPINKPECTTVAIPSPPILIPTNNKKPEIFSEPIPLPPPGTKTSKEEVKQRKGVFTKLLEMVGVAPKEDTKSVFYDEQAQEVDEPTIPTEQNSEASKVEEEPPVEEMKEKDSFKPEETPLLEDVKGKISSEIEEILGKAKTEVENLLQDRRSQEKEPGETTDLVNTMKLMMGSEQPPEEVEELKVTTEEERKRHKNEPASSKLSDQILKAIPPPRRKAISEASASGSGSGSGSGSTGAIPKPQEQKTPAGKHPKPSSIPVPPPRSRGKPTQPSPSKGKGKK